MSPIDKIVTAVGLVASLAAAGFWLRGSVIEVPDNIDTIVGELQRIGRLNAWAAMAALIAALCAAYAFWRQLT
jgi:Trm5-related predicted tRNA methylase